MRTNDKNSGWLTKGLKKKVNLKRPLVMITLDLDSTYKPRRVEEVAWLEDSLPFWSQLRVRRQAKRRIKRAKKDGVKAQ